MLELYLYDLEMFHYDYDFCINKNRFSILLPAEIVILMKFELIGAHFKT